MRDKRHRARAMVLSAPLTLIALCIGLRFVAAHRPDLRDPNYYAKERLLTKHLAKEEPDRITIVALGSSRTGNTFHPPTVEAELEAATGRPCLAFNHSLPGNGPVGQMLHMRRLVERGIRPDMVVIEIIPSLCGTTSGIHADTGIMTADRVTRDEMELLEEIGFVDDDFRKHWREVELNPWFSFRFQLLGLIQPKWTPPGVVRHSRKYADPTGWSPWTQPVKPEDYQKNLQVTRDGFYDKLQALEVSRVAMTAYQEIFNTCKRHGVIVVAVFSPESSDFRGWYGPKAHKATAVLKGMAEEGTDGNVVDASDWLPDAVFFDGHHVTANAAIEFSRRLAKEGFVPALNKAGER